MVWQWRLEQGLTIALLLKIDHISNADVDDTEKTLVLLHKFLLIEYLDRENAIFIDSPTVNRKSQQELKVPKSGIDAHVKIFIPVWI